jgi:CRISPR system Cascade subunit CasA
MMTMNLTIDPWIPAVRANGRRELFSLQELFAQARELYDLAVKPHERVALMRLLLCITQAALDGPADETEWQKCEPLIQRSVRGYLQKWLGAFELFGEGPRFLQTKPGVVAELSPVMENEGITRLDLCLASGESNATLFDNSGSERRSLIAARAAICLLTYQCYSPLLGRGYKGRSPCADNSMLHTFLVSTNLLQTIQLNLLDHTTMQDCYGSDGVGHPIWEAVPKGPPSESSRRMLTQTYLGRLVPMARSIWLTSAQEIVLGNGLVYESFLDSGYREAAATVTTLKTKLVVLRAQSDKAIWREFPAICIRNRSSDGVSGPLAFRNQICDSQVGVWVGALVSDQAKIEDVIEARPK